MLPQTVQASLLRGVSTRELNILCRELRATGAHVLLEDSVVLIRYPRTERAYTVVFGDDTRWYLGTSETAEKHA